MGIVAKQSVWNTITLFVGVFLGAINTMILFPMMLESDEYGLTRIIVTIGLLGGQFAMMGMPSILIKFLHKFRRKEGNSYGMLRFVIVACVFGIAVVGSCLYFGKAFILLPYENNAKALGDKYFLLIPFVLFVVVNGILSQYLKAVFHSVYQLVISEIFMRVAQTFLLFLYYFELFSFDFFMLYFVLIYGMQSLLLLAYLIKIKEYDVKEDKEIMTRKNRKSFFKYGIANFFSGLGFKLSNMIDILMIGSMIGITGIGENQGLKAIAIYSLAVFMSSVIEIPARAIGNIAFPLVGKAWANNNLEEVSTLYKKSAINQLVVGGLIFIGIWINIDHIILILIDISNKSFDYSTIKYVVFFLGLAKLFHVASGINGGIIMTSRYYLFGTYITISLIFITLFTNWIFIPIYGIVGAALATAISLLLFNLVSFLFLLVKLKMQPFTIKTFFTVIIGFLAFFLTGLLPEIGSPIFNVILQSIVVFCVYVPLIVVFKISEDINALAYKVWINIRVLFTK
jgi:O-antigen/teichoic acid export membrane protein